jgi:hypothetical protein
MSLLVMDLQGSECDDRRALPPDSARVTKTPNDAVRLPARPGGYELQRTNARDGSGAAPGQARQSPALPSWLLW